MDVELVAYTLILAGTTMAGVIIVGVTIMWLYSVVQRRRNTKSGEGSNDL